MNKDFGKYIYMIEGEEKLKAWLESGHDWECYEYEGGESTINVVAGKWKNNHKTCNGPLCLRCGYNPCWHCESIPTTCKQPLEENKQNMDDMDDKRIELYRKLSDILHEYVDMGAEISIEPAFTIQEIEEKTRGVSMKRVLPLQKKYLITIVFDYPKIGKEISRE